MKYISALITPRGVSISRLTSKFLSSFKSCQISTFLMLIAPICVSKLRVCTSFNFPLLSNLAFKPTSSVQTSLPSSVYVKLVSHPVPPPALTRFSPSGCSVLLVFVLQPLDFCPSVLHSSSLIQYGFFPAA